MLGILKARLHRTLSEKAKIAGQEPTRVNAVYLKKVEGPRAVKLADGTCMTVADLPPPDTNRWVASRKLAVVRGVAYGLITQEDAQARYGLSAEEFSEWVKAVARHGEQGLKATQRTP